MSERRYTIELKGITPLLMHRDNIEIQDEERKRGRDRDVGRAGDDRFPADKWKSYIYAAENIGVPAENLMACLREAGKKIKDGRSSLKSISQYGVLIESDLVPIQVGKKGAKISATKVRSINGTFEDQEAAAKALGFDLDVRRCRVQRARHIRVRPKFSNWKLSFPVTVTDDQLTDEQFQAIWYKAGDLIGLCDWRPGAPQPGPYGRFEPSIKRRKK